MPCHQFASGYARSPPWGHLNANTEWYGTWVIRERGPFLYELGGGGGIEPCLIRPLHHHRQSVVVLVRLIGMRAVLVVHKFLSIACFDCL